MVLVFAHNFKGYDGHFIMKDIFHRDFTVVHPILNGSKNLKIDAKNVRFIDSLSFFLLPLSALPKAFGFENIMLKGYFPYEFNTHENRNYIGILPSKEFFGYHKMNPTSKITFDLWYNTRIDQTFNLQAEMEMYCLNDVEILT